jgi:PAS domain S-box-containing protein
MNENRDIRVPGSITNPSTIKSVVFWIALAVLAGQVCMLYVFHRELMNTEFIVMAFGTLPILATLELNRRDNTQTAGGILAVSLTVLTTVLATMGAGIYDIAVMSYPAILVIGSLILKRGSTDYLTLLIIGCVAWLVLGSTLGFYQPDYPEQTLNRQFLIVSIILMITAFAVRILSGMIHRNVIAMKHELDERKKIETTLRETEELYRDMVERTSVITYRDTADLESKNIYVSPQIQDLLGYSQEEWQADPLLWLKVTHPDDLATVKEMIAACLESGERTVAEYRLLSKRGEWVWFRDESVLVKDASGKPQYIHGVLIEITDRKKVEEKVHQREAILGAVAQTAQQLLRASDWRKEINTILKLLGEATGASHVYIFENHMGPDTVMLSSQTYEWAAPGMTPELNNPVYQNTRLVPTSPGLEDWYSNLSNGKPFYGSGHQYPRYWKRVFEERGLKTLLDMPILVNGEWWGIIGFDDFVNEMPWSQAEIDALAAAAGNLGTAIARQQSDAALRASEEKFQHAFHHTYVSMAISRTTENTLMDVNDSFCKATGYSRQEAIGKRAGRDLNIWVRREDRDYIMNTLEQQRFIDEYRAEFRRKNGDIGIGLLSAVRVSIAGEICHLFTFYDISKMDQLMNELKAKNEELQNFTYTVSHDLKAPLVTISGFLGYLEQDARKGDLERVKRDSLRINEAVTKMQRLLNELLELSRIGRLTNPPETVPFKEIVDEALRVVEGRLQARQIPVRVEADLPSVYGDKMRLVEVIQNLVDNAAKFMGEQQYPTIEIGIERSAGGRAYYVRDNGIGVEPEQHERIFGLFNKLDATTEGTGIGLALVKRIIEVHGGRIWLDSEGRGKGSTFYFTLADSQDTGDQT